MNTEIQNQKKRQIDFIEFVLDVEFEGDLDDNEYVNWFIDSYLDAAKDIMNDAISSYYSSNSY